MVVNEEHEIIFDFIQFIIEACVFVPWAHVVCFSCFHDRIVIARFQFLPLVMLLHRTTPNRLYVPYVLCMANFALCLCHSFFPAIGPRRGS